MNSYSDGAQEVKFSFLKVSLVDMGKSVVNSWFAQIYKKKKKLKEKISFCCASNLMLSLLNCVHHAFLRLTCLCVFAPKVPYGPSCLTFLCALHAIRELLTHRVLSIRLVLCALRSFQNRFVVQQKLPIFQRILNALQTVLFLCGSKNNRETF